MLMRGSGFVFSRRRQFCFHVEVRSSSAFWTLSARHFRNLISGGFLTQILASSSHPPVHGASPRHRPSPPWIVCLSLCKKARCSLWFFSSRRNFLFILFHAFQAACSMVSMWRMSFALDSPTLAVVCGINTSACCLNMLK